HVCVAGEHTRPVGQTPSSHGAPGWGSGEKQAAHSTAPSEPATLIVPILDEARSAHPGRDYLKRAYGRLLFFAEILAAPFDVGRARELLVDACDALDLAFRGEPLVEALLAEAP